MKIYITSGAGFGRTPLSAFDAALKDAGIYNYNLIALSSIIPPGSRVVAKKIKEKKEEYGHKLYVIKAEIRSRESRKFIGATLGWYQVSDGRGVFVEHKEIGETKEAVESNLAKEVRDSITDLCHYRNFPFKIDKIGMKTSIVEVKDIAASALVIAVYQSEKWEGIDDPTRT